MTCKTYFYLENVILKNIFENKNLSCIIVYSKYFLGRFGYILHDIYRVITFKLFLKLLQSLVFLLFY